ncbi:UNVERIFIED_CONTAM: hypothetical protein LBW93_05095 [Wolbachia endosymbiont of Nasonia longicornis]
MKEKAKYTKKKNAINAIDAIHQKIDKAIVEQEKRATNKQDIENDKWTDKIKKTEIIYGITWAFALKILCTEA